MAIEVSNEVATLAMKVASAANTAQYGGATLAIYGGFTANEIGIFGGLAIAFLGYVTKNVLDWHFQREHLKLERARFEAAAHESRPT